eukprot:Skav231654  [mRNA]  locus=scaffold4482:194174:197595:- [translate_table: standard]
MLDRKLETYAQVHAGAVANDASYTPVGVVRNLQWFLTGGAWHFKCQVDLKLLEQQWLEPGDLAILSSESGDRFASLNGILSNIRGNKYMPAQDGQKSFIVEVRLSKVAELTWDAQQVFLQDASTWRLRFILIPPNEKKAIQLLQDMPKLSLLQGMSLTVPRSPKEIRKEMEMRPLMTREEVSARWAASNLTGCCLQAAEAYLHSALMKCESNSAPRRISFDSIVIDEAAQASEPDIVLPTTLARHRAIVVGDHKQLGLGQVVPHQWAFLHGSCHLPRHLCAGPVVPEMNLCAPYASALATTFLERMHQNPRRLSASTMLNMQQLGCRKDLEFLVPSSGASEVPNASQPPELPKLAMVRVEVGGSGVDPSPATAELHLARQEGAGILRIMGCR